MCGCRQMLQNEHEIELRIYWAIKHISIKRVWHAFMPGLSDLHEYIARISCACVNKYNIFTARKSFCPFIPPLLIPIVFVRLQYKYPKTRYVIRTRQDPRVKWKGFIFQQVLQCYRVEASHRRHDRHACWMMHEKCRSFINNFVIDRQTLSRTQI